MITINQIATELENILNQTSPNVPKGVKPPFNGLFAVRTEGYVLDNVHDYETGKNFFPVFLGQSTGDYNPIPDLEQIDMEIPVSIYFPVRFKDKMLEMQEFLNKVFVGRAIGFNQVDGKYQQYTVSNISMAELGEITDLDVDQFGNSILKGLNKFIAEQYKAPVSTSEPWICLTFSLYLSTMKNALGTDASATIYGNAYSINIAYKGDFNETITTDNVSIAYGATAESQQGFTLNTGVSDLLSKSLAVTSAVSYTFEAVVHRNAFWKEIMGDLLQGKLEPNEFALTLALKDDYKSGEDTDYADYEANQILVVLTNLTTNFGTNEPLCVEFTFTPHAGVF